MIVEAHTVGQDDWLPEPERAQFKRSASTRRARTAGATRRFRERHHPFLTHYQTFDPATGMCSPTGTTGEWNAANGSSSGWQPWQIDLGAYAGKQVEVSITVVSDWAFQQFPSVLVDDIVVSTGEGVGRVDEGAERGSGGRYTPTSGEIRRSVGRVPQDEVASPRLARPRRPRNLGPDPARPAHHCAAPPAPVAA
jgi:hypothetical protein